MKTNPKLHCNSSRIHWRRALEFSVQCLRIALCFLGVMGNLSLSLRERNWIDKDCLQHVLRYYILFDRINSWKMLFSFVFNVNSFFIMENPSSKWIYEHEPLEHQNLSYNKATDLVHCKPWIQLGAVHPPLNPGNRTSVFGGLDQMAINMPSKPWLAVKSWIERVKLENHGFLGLVCESGERIPPSPFLIVTLQPQVALRFYTLWWFKQSTAVLSKGGSFFVPSHLPIQRPTFFEKL